MRDRIYNSLLVPGTRGCLTLNYKENKREDRIEKIGESREY